MLIIALSIFFYIRTHERIVMADQKAWKTFSHIFRVFNGFIQKAQHENGNAINNHHHGQSVHVFTSEITFTVATIGLMRFFCGFNKKQL